MFAARMAAASGFVRRAAGALATVRMFVHRHGIRRIVIDVVVTAPVEQRSMAGLRNGAVIVGLVDG
ncbi:MAG: hypothetical protein OHK0052_23720 [Anaerolineales bacterium]